MPIGRALLDILVFKYRLHCPTSTFDQKSFFQPSQNKKNWESEFELLETKKPQNTSDLSVHLTRNFSSHFQQKPKQFWHLQCLMRLLETCSIRKIKTVQNKTKTTVTKEIGVEILLEYYLTKM